MLLSICLIFCQFQPGVAYKYVPFKKNVYFGSYIFFSDLVSPFALACLEINRSLQQYYLRFLSYIQSNKCQITTGKSWEMLYNFITLHFSEDATKPNWIKIYQSVQTLIGLSFMEKCDVVTAPFNLTNWRIPFSNWLTTRKCFFPTWFFYSWTNVYDGPIWEFQFILRNWSSSHIKNHILFWKKEVINL